MPYGQRGTRYYSRRGGTGGIAPFFFLPRRERVQGQGWARVVSFIRVKSMRVESVGPCNTYAARTQVDLNNPASRSFEHARGAADA